MSTSASLPYYTADENDVACGRWHFVDQSGLEVLVGEDGIPGWDYHFDLTLTREVTCDASNIKAACRLPQDARLLLTVTADCAASRFRRCIIRQPLRASGRSLSRLRFTLDSTSLADSLKLRTEVLLEAPHGGSERFAARHAGSRLFMKEDVVQLEGSRSRFPVRDADFEKELAYLRAPNAYWHLYWRKGDMEAPAVTALMLMLNRRHQAFLERAKAGDETVSALIFIDAARRLLAEGLMEDDFVHANPGSYPDDSIGQVVENLTSAAFPSRSKAEVRSLMEQDRAAFEAAVQSAFAQS